MMPRLEFSVAWVRSSWPTRTTPTRKVFAALNGAERHVEKLQTRYDDLTLCQIHRREVGEWLITTRADAEDLRAAWARERA